MTAMEYYHLRIFNSHSTLNLKFGRVSQYSQNCLHKTSASNGF